MQTNVSNKKVFTAYELAYIDQAIQSNSEEDVVSHLFVSQVLLD